MNNLKKISKIVNLMNLSKKEKDLYLDFFKNNPNYSEEIINFWELKLKAKNLKSKKLWNNLIKKEYEFLESVSTKEKINEAKKQLK